MKKSPAKNFAQAKYVTRKWADIFSEKKSDIELFLNKTVILLIPTQLKKSFFTKVFAEGFGKVLFLKSIVP